MKIHIAKIILAGLIFASQMSFAQGLSKNCIDEIVAISKKNANFDLMNFSKDLVTETVKVKAQLKLPFGKPADSKVTDIGMTVGCLKALPENPAQLQGMLKGLGSGLLATASQKALAQGESFLAKTEAAPAPKIEAQSILVVNNLTSVVGYKIFVGTQNYGGHLDANGTYKLNLLKLCGGTHKVYVFGGDGYIYNKSVYLECNKSTSVNFGDGSWQYSIMEPQVVRTLMAVKYAEAAKAKAVAAAEKAEAAAVEATAAITRKAMAAAAATADTAAKNAEIAAMEALEAAKNAELATAEALEAAKTNESIAQTSYAVDISGLAVKAADYAKSAAVAATKAVAANKVAASEAAQDDIAIATKVAARAITQVEAAKAEAEAAKAEARMAKEGAARADADAKAAREAAANAAADAAKAVANVKTSVDEAILAKVQTVGTTGIIIGPGVLVYGVVRNLMAVKSINENEFSEAKEHVKSRNSAYTLGMAVLLAGTSIKIFF